MVCATLCQVDSCSVDVSTLPAYFSRRRICVEHSKAKQVLKDGLPHRLCQQCNRLQPLADFRGSRRSCEKKLKVHASRIKLRKIRKQKEAKIKIKVRAKYLNIGPANGARGNLTSHLMQGNAYSQEEARETSIGKAADGSVRASKAANAAMHAASTSPEAAPRTSPPLNNTDIRDGQSYSIVWIQPVILLAAIPFTFHHAET